MARPILEAHSLSKAFAGHTLFDGAALQIDVGERVALVGPNGSGKTTLLAILRGQAEPDTGSARLAPHARIVAYDQHPHVPPGASGRDILALAVGVPAELQEELAQLEQRIADPALYETPEAESVLSRFGEVQREIARVRASRAADDDGNALLEDLGLTGEDLARPVASLSGGERTRLFLARTLSEADPQGLLILDEPTNHLDVERIEWLEEWLLEWPGAVLLVAHDRAFLDNVATRVVAFERGRLVSYVGNYTEFERVREEDRQRLERQREREQQELLRQKAVIEQFRHQKRFNGQMASRLTHLEKYRAAIDRTPDPLVERVQFSAQFPQTFKSSNEVVRVRRLGKKFGDRVLFHDLDFDLMKGDRVALVGANGAGKTTLLKILTGREKKELGSIEVAPGTVGAYYAQGSENLILERNLADEVLDARPGLGEEDVRALLGRFGFRSEQDPARRVATLSGGERARLALLKCVVGPSNLLILDEPTNHLDLESRKTLAAALNAYKGTLLVCSHDRWFLDSVVDKVAVLARRQLKTFAGDFTSARTASAMEEFSVEKPTAYVVRKGFKDFDAGVKHAVGSRLLLTPAELNGKRLWKTALSLGWMVPEDQ